MINIPTVEHSFRPAFEGSRLCSSKKIPWNALEWLRRV